MNIPCSIFILFSVLFFSCSSQSENKRIEGIEIPTPENWIDKSEIRIKDNLANYNLKDEEISKLLKNHNGSVPVVIYTKYEPSQFNGPIPTIQVLLRPNNTKNINSFKKTMEPSLKQMADALSKFKILSLLEIIEIDGFKKVNDTYGENLRNRLVKKVVSQFTRILREGDTLSRIGGDEFVVIINNLSKPSASDAIVSRLLKSVTGTLLVKKKSLKISTSVGLTCYPLDNVSRDELIKHADHAMYIAKQKGINNRHVFDIEKDVAEKHHNEELRRIAQALKDDEFLLYYQPKVDLRTNEVVGFEGLIRWDHPDNGLLAPAMFLPVVENDILGIEMGRWVINKALLQLQYALSIGYDIPISVNISPLHLQHDEFVSDLKEILSRYPNFKAGSLEFEILETSALKDIDIVSTVIRECNKLGVLSSIDDFGTGYSSLTYLRRLPADFLKIDQSFVKGVLTSSDDKAIVQGIIELAKIFNLKVVAEGVETPEHGEILLSMGSYIAQGYGIAKPMPAKDILTWLVNWKNNPCLVDRSI